MTNSFLFIITIGIALVGCDNKNNSTAPAIPTSNIIPNIVIIQTDDQRWDMLADMPTVQAELVQKGVVFNNAFSSSPQCMPSRSSLLSGGNYASNTQVLNNNPPNGGFDDFIDTYSVAVALQKSGYTTGLVGKYLNHYGQSMPYIPPGWDSFVVDNLSLATGNPYSYKYVVGSSQQQPSVGQIYRADQYYITHFQRDQAVDFINTKTSGPKPFFLLLNLHSPHTPADPEVKYAADFPNYLYRGRSYGEADISDKPEAVQLRGNRTFTPPYKDHADLYHKNALRTLLTVDDTVAAIINALTVQGKIDNTMIVYVSDHGYLWGEHQQWGKSQPYEESIRVPLIIRTPAQVSKQVDKLVVANLDLGATLLAIAGVNAPTDGLDLLPLIAKTFTPWRTEFFVESFKYSGNYHMWTGIRTETIKYVEYGNGNKEFYDLVSDPYEENNIYNTLPNAKKTKLASQVENFRGVSIVDNLPLSAYYTQVGQAYNLQLQAWGTPPYTWSLAQGSLPQGLSLNPINGNISGIPAQAESQKFWIQLTSEKTATYTGNRKTFLREFTIVVQ